MLKNPKELLAAAQARQREMLQWVKTLVEIESPSENKAAVDQASQQVAAWTRAMGGQIRWHRQKNFGDLLEARFAAQTMSKSIRAQVGREQKRVRPILLLGHLDTV